MLDETDRVRGQLFTKKNEGLRLKAYKCPTGHLTIGWGHNLDAHGIEINLQQAQAYFDEDYDRARRDAQSYLGEDLPIDRLDPVRQAALIDMSFQMGGGALKQFKGMRAAILRGDWDDAAEHCLGSLYARQTPKRASEVAHMLKTGRWA